MILGSSPLAKTRLLSFHRLQSRAVTSLLTRHNTPRTHLYIMGPIDSPICRRCGAEEETWAHVLCECEALAALRHTYLGSCFLDPEEIRSLNLGTIWNFIEGTGLPWLGHQFKRYKLPVKKAYVHQDQKGSNPLTKLFHSILFYSILFYSKMHNFSTIWSPLLKFRWV